MRSAALFSAISLTVCTALCQSRPEKDAAIPTIQTTSNLVIVPTVVRSGTGAPIQGLRPGDFTLTDNGVEQKIFAEEVSKQGLAIAVLMQTGAAAPRDFQNYGDAKYMDVLEKILYNGLISGIGLDGKSFFYTNAMQVTHNFKHNDIEFSRSGWFECSCCPTNLVRLIPSIPGYVYAQKEDNLFVNLFINGTADMTIKNTAVQIVQQNEYPWSGQLAFIVSPAKATVFTMRIRIPGWAQGKAIPSDLYRFENSDNKKIPVKVNGEDVAYTMENGYALISRNWKKDDKITLELPMDVQRVTANGKIADDVGKTALQRGPIMYCAEWVDNDGQASNIIIPAETKFTTEFQPALLNGVTVLKAEVPSVVIENGSSISTVKRSFTAIPYYSWANRGPGEMTVWFPVAVKSVSLLSQ